MRWLWVLFLAGCAVAPRAPQLSLIRQLTFDGTHAEAYFSFDGSKIILQAVREGDKADQIYILDLATNKVERVSSGKGKAT